MKKKTLAAKIDAAKHEIVRAEKDLKKVLNALKKTPRAEKTSISNALEKAISKLSTARVELVEVETVLTQDKA